MELVGFNELISLFNTAGEINTPPRDNLHSPYPPRPPPPLHAKNRKIW